MNYRKIAAMAAASAIVVALASGCTKESEVNGNATTYITRTYTAGIGEGTKTSVDENGKVTWNAGDVVRYYSADGGTVGEVTAAEDGEKAQFTMQVASDASYLVAVYGGSSLKNNTGTEVTVCGAIPAEQSGVFGDNHVSAVSTTDMEATSLQFSNVTSFIKFTLERTDVAKIIFSSNDDTALTGCGEVKLSFSDEGITPSFGDSKSSAITISSTGAGTFYIATLPCTMAEGFSIDCYDANGKCLGSAVSDKAATVRKGTILNLGTIDSRIETVYKDLSKEATANSYIVTNAGCYKFNASVKGNSSEKVDGTPVKAEVIWETLGTDSKTNVGDLVKDVTYADGYITFEASDKKGNALIAVKDASENILWSWHIWMTDQPADQVYNNNAGTMMDRNLGATSAAKGEVGAFGLLYQWGRKDPFMGKCTNGTSAKAAVSTISTWPSVATSDETIGTVAYTVANPTTYIVGTGDNNYDWQHSLDKTLWSSSKTMYDPCPAGYRVPDGDNSGIWARALGALSRWQTLTNWDSTDRGMDLGSTDKTLGSGMIWYPAAGCLNGSYSIVYSGTEGDYWSCTISGNSGCFFGIDSNAYIWPAGSIKSQRACSVRCCKE